VTEATSKPLYGDIVAERLSGVQGLVAAALSGTTRFLWEVGCGHGHFLTAYATAHPDKTCIGVDIASDRIERAVRKKNRVNLPNLHFVRAEANLFLRAIPATAQISEVFILFPDPWPKSRHHKHRLLQPDFLTAVAAKAGENCRIYFRTDDHAYFEYASKVLRSASAWSFSTEPWPFEFETVFQSRAVTHESFVAQLR
jgi:tRNA (guanine-N7-)-methyltransferase